MQRVTAESPTAGAAAWRRTRAAVRRATVAAAEEARRARLELALRRARSRLRQEEARLGRMLHPLLANDTMEVDSPAVREAVRRITALTTDVEAKQRLRGTRRRSVTALGALGAANAIAGVVNVGRAVLGG